jgi:hypothetical protein
MDRIDFVYKETELSVLRPNLKQRQESKQVSNRVFNEALKNKAILRLKVDEVLREQGVWDETKEARFTEIQDTLAKNEKILVKGDKRITKKDARRIALKMRELRNELRGLLYTRGQLESRTAEGQADDAAFQYLVAACTVYKANNQPYFKGLDDYLERSNEIVALQAAQHLTTLEYGDIVRYEANLPEIKFLQRFGFMDDKLRLKREDGRLIDEDGRLIDEDGRYVSEDGKFVDRDGNPVDEQGNYSYEFEGFADEDGDAKEEAPEEDVIEENAQTV